MNGSTATLMRVQGSGTRARRDVFYLEQQPQTLESRSAMAYWQNGKLYLATSTQSSVQTVMAFARWLHMEPTDIVLLTAYCGGGFGSKAGGTISSVIPAVLAKKTGMPVMMRISREKSTASACPAVVQGV